jgi:hypothetical protein
MLENIITREEHRQIILKGISQDLTHSEISAQLGANRWGIRSDIKSMQRNGDLEFRHAEKAQSQVREKKLLLQSREKNHFKQNEKFLRMTGITLQEKNFRNMINFNKHELRKILKSKDQQAEIIKLPKSIQKTLKKNGILTKKWQDSEITKRAQEYLTARST